MILSSTVTKTAPLKALLALIAVKKESTMPVFSDGTISCASSICFSW
jgi:hypothetical protein